MARSIIGVSAADFVSNLHPGWNLGNTLDAIPDEGSWNNVPVDRDVD
jgi:endoglucanase